MKKKTIALVMSLVLIVGCMLGGTVAWLTAKTDEVKNTFTVGDINITLTETTGDTYKMVPGSDITKDPKVTVKADSEACWLFIKVEKSENFDTFMTYDIADGWTELENGVYYCQVDATTSDTEFAVLKDNKVNVKDTVTKEMLTATDFTEPTLTFTSYAVQKDNIADVNTAWTEAQK